MTARSIRLTAAALAAVVLSALTLAPAAAAAPTAFPAGPASPAAAVTSPAAFPLVANIVVGSRRFNGFFVPTGDTVKLTQKRAGATLATATKVADGFGSVSAKLKPLQPDDTVLVDVNGSKRTIRIPDLRLSIDAGTDRLSGRVPTSQLEADLSIAQQVGSYTLGGDPRHFTAHADGTFSEDVTGIHDVQGGELVQLTWTSPADDAFVLDSFAPAMTAEVGRATVDVYGKRGTTATVTLKASNGTVRASAKVTLPVDGRPAIATFRKGGVAVKVKAGDRIVHSAAPSIAFTLLASTLVLTAADGGDIGATCFPNSLYVLGRVYGSGAVDELANGPTDNTGALSVADISRTGTTLPSGYRVILLCEDSRGDAQVFRAAVP